MSAEGYYWLRFFHFAAFVSWMAMLFYLPRLFVYHAEHIENKAFCEVIKIQERKLYNGIGWIAMFGTAGTGLAIWLLAKPDLIAQPYFHVKLVCAALMVAYHLSLGHYMKLFREDRCFKPGKFFRVYNEVPTIIMCVILYEMVVKAYLG